MSTVGRWPPGLRPVWGASPPPPRVRKYDRLRIIGQKPTRLVIIGDALEEIDTHQVNGRTVPCGGPPGRCPFDHVLVGKPRYGGWLAVQVVGLPEVRLVMLTAVAVSLDVRLRDRSKSLRGLTLDLWRLHGHERSEMRSQIRVEVPVVEDLPPAPDVRYAVERMLEADNRADDRNRRERLKATSLDAILDRSYAFVPGQEER